VGPQFLTVKLRLGSLPPDIRMYIVESQTFLIELQFVRLYAKLTRPGDSEVTFAVFE